MRIKSLDKAFDQPGLGELVAKYVSDPKVKQIKVSSVVNAVHIEKKETGLFHFLQKCVVQFDKVEKEKRQKQLAKGLFHSYKILKAAVDEKRAPREVDESFATVEQQVQKVRKKSRACDELFRSIMSETASRVSNGVASSPNLESKQSAEDLWLETQKHTLEQLASLADQIPLIKKMNAKTTKLTKRHEKANHLTTHEAKHAHASRTLHGKPYDQRRLGKLGENVFVPGFENFYIAGSECKMRYGTYDIMQAPIAAHEDKVDTVKDFWDTVVVMRRSPIIVTTHDPKEKVPKFGYAQRAEYWTADRFNPPMQLRGGWQLSRIGEDVVIATSRHSDEIRLVQREFLAKNPTMGEEHTVTQFHYQGWPDHHGAPDHELLELTHQAVDREFSKRGLPSHAPITVHCAAGMGRSPAFALSNVLRRELHTRLHNGESLENMTLEVPKTAFGFKKQRPSVLAGDEHWQSVLYSQRRCYLRLKGVGNGHIQALEERLEKRIIAKGKQELEQDAEEFRTKQARNPPLSVARPPTQTKEQRGGILNWLKSCCSVM